MSGLVHQPETAIAQREPVNMLEAVMQAVRDPKMDPARLREFLEIGERLEARQAKKEFDQAMHEMQPKLPVIKKNGLITRPPTAKYPNGSKTPFAKWDDVYKACMPLLAQHGFSCSFSSELQGTNALRVLMTVKHIGGHEEMGSLVVPWLDDGGSKSPAQAASSSFTLAERHVFIKFFNVLTEGADDDGNGGAPERITDDQRKKLAALIDAKVNLDLDFQRRFDKRLKLEMNCESIADLFQGKQYEAVMGWFRK